MGEQKRKDRQALITKALLLGYSFDRYMLSTPSVHREGWLLFMPNGEYTTEYIHRDGKSFGPDLKVFPAQHLAAAYALIDAGVLDATKPSGDTGVGSGKSDRLRERARERSSAKSFSKSPWLG